MASILEQLKEWQYWVHAGIIAGIFWIAMYVGLNITSIKIFMFTLVLSDIIAHLTMEKIFGWED